MDDINLYEFNKINMAQIEPVDAIWFNKHCSEVAKEILTHPSQYWMLLCRERYDITIFNLLSPKSEENLSKELRGALNNRGEIIDFTKREDNNYEIWIRDFTTKENFVYYLFDYSEGVIET